MARPKGTPKTGGRKKGTPNKITAEMRQWIGKLVYKNRKQIEADLKELEPKERLDILEKFMQYSVPKMQRVDTKIDFGKLTDNQLDDIIDHLENEV